MNQKRIIKPVTRSSVFLSVVGVTPLIFAIITTNSLTSVLELLLFFIAQYVAFI